MLKSRVELAEIARRGEKGGRSRSERMGDRKENEFCTRHVRDANPQTKRLRWPCDRACMTSTIGSNLSRSRIVKT